MTKVITVITAIVQTVLMDMYMMSYDPFTPLELRILMDIGMFVITYLVFNLFASILSPGKKDPSSMNNREKETFDFQRSFTGFSGGFFGTAAAMVTNMISTFSEKKGYQNHPTIFRCVYCAMTLGFSIFNNIAVDSLLNGMSVDNKPEVHDCNQ